MHSNAQIILSTVVIQFTYNSINLFHSGVMLRWFTLYSWPKLSRFFFRDGYPFPCSSWLSRFWLLTKVVLWSYWFTFSVYFLYNFFVHLHKVKKDNFISCWGIFDNVQRKAILWIERTFMTGKWDNSTHNTWHKKTTKWTLNNLFNFFYWGTPIGWLADLKGEQLQAAISEFT